MSDHFAAVLAEATEDEQRVVREANAPICDHKRLTVVARFGGGLDDHETSYLVCRCGDAGVVETAYANGRFEHRPMTASELKRFGPCVNTNNTWRIESYGRS